MPLPRHHRGSLRSLWAVLHRPWLVPMPLRSETFPFCSLLLQACFFCRSPSGFDAISNISNAASLCSPARRKPVPGNLCSPKRRGRKRGCGLSTLSFVRSRQVLFRCSGSGPLRRQTNIPLLLCTQRKEYNERKLQHQPRVWSCAQTDPSKAHCWLSQRPVPNRCSCIPTAEPLLGSCGGPARMLHFAGMMWKERPTGEDRNPPT